MIKTTKKHFDYFCDRVRYWVEYLGLSGWRLDFNWEHIEGCYAEFTAQYIDRVALFRFCREWENSILPFNKQQIDRTARHEAIHLLACPLHIMAVSRYVTKDEIHYSLEQLTRRIEDLMDKL